MIFNRRKSPNGDSVYLDNPGENRRMGVKKRSLPPLRIHYFNESFAHNSSVFKDYCVEQDESSIKALKSLSQKVLSLKNSESWCEKNSFEFLYGKERTPTFGAAFCEYKKEVNEEHVHSPKLPGIHKGLIQVNSRFPGNAIKDHRLVGGRLVKKVRIAHSKFPKDMF